MTQQRWLVALVLIAIGAYSHWARAEKVYKCGTTYSQTPCQGSTTLNVDDTRDPAEKKRMDAQTKRDAELGQDMQQSRLTNEAALAAERAHIADSAAKLKQARQTAKEPAAEPVLVYARKPRLNRPHKPDGFTAVAPGTVQKISKPHKKRTDGAR
ncbi:hypothetical protein [Rhodoferax antarcticus]|uniref:DUF4124 domain-containing protein n=1 Tax=Rhodoferax antarcticus ANT.BR TaxID=1111071 RepID=A0A1Q8YKJ8_9BURK|nr:hypothetical protein [Rhodoferax antarcticus]APW47353.1 hypothetical protein RA876_14445 [Rhodoferax antarcticus]MCW2311953.1 hypothetical protein [Rhodoferax antarcticus]OLP08459.1 hypothetical protein BLL52_0065 [Rhodoferax antarcticus ANT.BR]